MKNRILVQWIGHSDLRAMASSLPEQQRRSVLKGIGGVALKPSEIGPTKTLLSSQSFDQVRLLSNYPDQWNIWYLEWLGRDAEVVGVELEKPTDYVKIFEIADRELKRIGQHEQWQNSELCLHLSPGTPAMSAVWLLLGKTRYPAIFYETYRGDSWRTDIPFDITIDVLPEIFRNPDAHLQHLASHSPGEVEGFENVAGSSEAIRDAVGRAKRAAIRGVSILLLGESGTGKELFSQAIHQCSPRREMPFQAINCAALASRS